MTYIVLLTSVIVVPLLLWLHGQLINSLAAEKGGIEKLSILRRLFSIWTGAAFLLVAALIAVLIYLEPEPPDAPNLETFELSDYEGELQVIAQRTESLAPTEIEELVRIFRHAQRLIEIGELEEAEAVLLSLRQGNDQSGSFPKVESYTVDNTLGVVSYRIRRNSQFLASRYLYLASKNPLLTEAAGRVVAQNIERLDKAVNALD